MSAAANHESSGNCRVCGRICKLKRCQKCRNAYYCSRDCQKADWKAGHKKTCKRVDTRKAREAFQELHALVGGISLEQADELYHKAQRHVQTLREQNDTLNEAISDASLDAPPPNLTTARPTKPPQPTKPESSFVKQPTFLSPNLTSYMIEDMPHISCYQITLILANEPLDSDPLEASLLATNGDTTVLSLREAESQLLFQVQLPGTIQDPPIAVPSEDATLTLRLSYHPMESDFEETILCPVSVINEGQCRFCSQSLIPHKSIDRVLPLPSGNWDDVMDYLICYSGEPTVDFTSSSTMARQKTALEDASALVVHRQDVGDSLCVLAVEGYGQGQEPDRESAVTRGPRAWCDAVGGASICCSLCCSLLGYASLQHPETYRLLKHRIKAGDQPLSSTASFLMREMVRYAETKLIFTFVLALEDDYHSGKYRGMCLLMRLVSWDSKMAFSGENGNGPGLVGAHFRKVAKVIFEVTYDHYQQESQDLSSWVWGGVDLCCAPNLSSSNNVKPPDGGGEPSSVRLKVCQDEWDEVLHDLLDGTKFVSKSVADATILVKLGRKATLLDETLGLSVIAL